VTRDQLTKRRERVARVNAKRPAIAVRVSLSGNDSGWGRFVKVLRAMLDTSPAPDDRR
jgi:hypothetical protein